MGRLRQKLARDKIRVDPDAGLHTLRHTFLTEAGEHTDAFAQQYIAGHDAIKTTMRYVHRRAESVSRAFERMNQKKKSADQCFRKQAVESGAKEYVARSAYKNAYTEDGDSLKL